MERLTYRDANGELWYSDNGTERDRLHRLAAYEDTGLILEEAQQMRWIPVEERLPEEGKRCLLYTPCDGIICVGFYNGNDNWEHRHKWKLVTAMRSTQTLTKKVTHWMSLPQTPKEETYEK